MIYIITKYYTKQDINKFYFVKQTTELCYRIINCHAQNLKLEKNLGQCQPTGPLQADMSRYFWQMH